MFVVKGHVLVAASFPQLKRCLEDCRIQVLQAFVSLGRVVYRFWAHLIFLVLCSV